MEYEATENVFWRHAALSPSIHDFENNYSFKNQHLGSKSLLLKHKIHRADQQHESNGVVPVECFFLEVKIMKSAKTMSVITSCMTFSCTMVNGPPVSDDPKRLAGTWKQYSKNANPQLMSTRETNPAFGNQPHCLKLRWPYQASVINPFEIMRRMIVPMARMVLFFSDDVDKA